MDRYRSRDHHRDDARDRGDTNRKRDRSREPERGRERSQRTVQEEILSVLDNSQPISSKQREAMERYAREVDSIVPSSHIDSKELFVGNVVDIDASENNLCLLLNTAMRKLGMVHASDEPIIRCRKSKNYSFVIFNSTADCSMAMNLSGIYFKDSALKIKRPANFPGPTEAPYTWQDFLPPRNTTHTTAKEPPTSMVTSATHPATRTLREIFVGNTSGDMTDESLRDFLGGAMMKLGLSNSRNEHPVQRAHITGKFAFLEMRTCIDAANILNLTGIPFCGHSLKIERTAKYDGGCGIEAYLTWETLLQMWISGDLRLMTSGSPSRVIAISNVTTAEALGKDPHLYLDLIEETRWECSQFGVVRSVIVPRTVKASVPALHAHPSGPLNPVGKIFVEMDTTDQAILTLLSLKGRSFDHRIVDVKFYPEDAFRTMNYTVPPARVVITASFGVTPLDKVFTPAALGNIELEADL